MNNLIKGIVLFSEEYKEADKLVTILSCEEGRIKAVAKSARKVRAKLNFATEPFCFGEFELAKGRGYNILTGAELYESFYELRESAEKMYLAFSLSEIFLNASPLFSDYHKEVAFLAKSYSHISESENLPVLAVKLCFDLLYHSGYGFDNFDCIMCKEEVKDKKVSFSKSGEGFLCEDCDEGGIEVLKKTFDALRKICESDYDSLNKLKVLKDDYLECLRFFIKLIKFKLEFSPKSLIEFGKMISRL